MLSFPKQLNPTPLSWLPSALCHVYTRIFELAAWRPEYVNRDRQQQQKSTKGRERFLETITLQSPLFLPHVWISRGEGATICLSWKPYAISNRIPGGAAG